MALLLIHLNPRGPSAHATRPVRTGRPVRAGAGIGAALRAGAGRTGSTARGRPALPPVQGRSGAASTAHDRDRSAIDPGRGHPPTADHSALVSVVVCRDRAL